MGAAREAAKKRQPCVAARRRPQAGRRSTLGAGHPWCPHRGNRDGDSCSLERFDGRFRAVAAATRGAHSRLARAGRMDHAGPTSAPGNGTGPASLPDPWHLATSCSAPPGPIRLDCGDRPSLRGGAHDDRRRGPRPRRGARRSSVWRFSLQREAPGHALRRRTSGPGWCRRRLLGSGGAAAPGRESLALLPSGPDAVRTLPVRGTRPSTPRVDARAHDRRPLTAFGPAGADFGFREPLTPHLA
jgi:hypothetical protein